MKLSSLKKPAIIAASAALVAALALTGCSSQEEKASEETKVTVAATSTPHGEILNNAVAPILAEQGITLEIIEFSDYVQPNTVVEEGEIDANYFQHINYLDSFNAENGTHLVSVGYVHYEPMGIYAGKTTDLSSLAEGSVIAIPNDTTNEARALLLLEQEGLIKLAEGAGVTATPQDIVDNPLNLKFQELEAAQVPHALADVDVACINGNFALQAGLHCADALATESLEGEAATQYGNILVVKEGNENNPAIQALMAALVSDEVKSYITDTYNGAVIAWE